MTQFEVERGFHHALFNNATIAPALTEVGINANMRGNLVGLFCEEAIVKAIQSAPDTLQQRFRAGGAMGTVRFDSQIAPAGQQVEKLGFQTEEVGRIITATAGDPDTQKLMLLNFHEWTMTQLVSGRVADENGAIGVMGGTSFVARLQRAWKESDVHIEEPAAITGEDRVRVAKYDGALDRTVLSDEDAQRADVVERHLSAAHEGPVRDAALAALNNGGPMAAQNALIMAVGDIFAN